MNMTMVFKNPIYSRYTQLNSKMFINIFLVDDNLGDIRLTQEMLNSVSNLNYHFDWAENCSDGIKYLMFNKCDVILLDLTLPDSIGFDTYNKINEVANNTPIIVITGLKDEFMALNAVRNGAQDYLIKGQINGNLLIRSIQYAIERKLSEETWKQKTQSLLDYINELQCPYSIRNLLNNDQLPIEELLHKSVKFIPNAWYNSNLICAKLTYNNKDYFSDNFKETKKSISCNISFGEVILGILKIYYLKNDLKEVIINDDEIIMNTIALQIGSIIKCNQAEDLSRLKSDFLANMSHELRTPLNGILGFARLLNENKLKATQIFEALKTLKGNSSNLMIKDIDALESLLTFSFSKIFVYGNNISECGENLLELINDILDLSKIEAGKIILEPKDVQIHSIIDEMMIIVRPIIERKKLKIFYEIQDNLKHIYCDRHRLKQILLNIIDNAIKFTDKGSITISIDGYKEGVLFAVKDTGRGIPLEMHKKIFDRFRQVESGDGKEIGGTGLGLALCKELVKLHCGNIWIQSEVNLGTEVFFTINLTSDVIERSQSKIPIVFEDKTENALILLIEDDEKSTMFYQDCFEENGNQTIVAKDGLTGINIIDQWCLEVVILDMNLPGKNGEEVLGHIRAKVRTKNIVVIVITELDINEIKDLNVESILSKPISKELLVETVNNLLKNREKISIADDSKAIK